MNQEQINELKEKLNSGIEAMKIACLDMDMDWIDVSGNEAKYLLSLMEKESEAIKMLKVARCPNGNCDNAGTIAVAVRGQDGLPDYEPEQCEWCWHRDNLI